MTWLLSSCITFIFLIVLIVCVHVFWHCFQLTMKALHLLKQKENSGLLESHQMILIQFMDFLLQPACQHLYSNQEIWAMPLLLMTLWVISIRAIAYLAKYCLVVGTILMHFSAIVYGLFDRWKMLVLQKLPSLLNLQVMVRIWCFLN